MLRKNLSLEDTIFALTTGTLPTAVAVLKLSGPEAFSIADKLFVPSREPFSKTRNIWFGDLHCVDGKKIDDIVALSFVGPNSHSGDDTIEFHCHGSVAIIRALEKELLFLGARPAERGEFSYRSLLNGKQTPADLENLADLFKAVHSVDLEAVYSRRDGGLERKVNDLRAQMIKLQAVLDTAVDFAEEYSAVSEQAEQQIDKLIHECSEVTQRYSRFKSSKALPKIALVGRPNAGKSSLFNSMLGRYRAIVSAEAGTTRDVIEEQIEILGSPWMIADTAGIRSTPNEIEKQGIELGAAFLSSASIWILVVDGTQGITEDERLLLKKFESSPHLIFWNKKDRSDWSQEPKELSSITVQGSVLGDKGIEPFWLALENQVEALRLSHMGPTPTAIQSARLEGVTETLKVLKSQVSMGIPPEILAETNRKVMVKLENVVGKVEVDEVLGRIFSDFCIGK
ncbi:MAG: tRNA uridine-5-carboxymethylaminomethyl(34) synthesis GTPase MnmE [Deltaproteobacteria bacterium]|nr:tRNA uridine-5-carboxymethylaminomethyl(34) synthesis GTPase MnmE [Deltaproteobacteria bacterium]MBM4315972.1 tRNA uridine-5-carboxymethylaminomethyl(34) synthesis GTPase MnmE [Deltaproteobacteria bacterium]